MKQFLSFLFLCAVCFSASSQNYRYIDIQVWDSQSTNAVPAQGVWIKVYNGTAIVKSFRVYSDSSFFGGYRDSISTSLVFDSVVTYTFDCNGNKVRGIASPMLPSNWYLSDTLYQPCPMNGYAGQVGVAYTQSTTQPNTIDFVDNSIQSGFAGNKVTLYCFYGDNDSGVVSSNFSHAYPAPGKYYVQYGFMENDTLGKGYHTQDWYRDTIEVLPFAPTSFCQASYWVDTLNSGNNVALIYNNSTPSQKDTNYTTSYHWDFGDGDTSNLPYPNHTYASAGYYEICLTVNSQDSAGTSCTSTFCDSLGIDTTGALIYKNSSFSLQVLEPTIGVEEVKAIMNLTLFPNPVEDFVTITGLNEVEGKKLDFRVYSTSGNLLIQRQIENTQDAQILDLTKLQKGVYVLQLSSEGKIFNYRILKQ